MKVVLVEPYAHYGSHFPEEAKALAGALAGEGADVTLVTSYPLAAPGAAFASQSLFRGPWTPDEARRGSLPARLWTSGPAVRVRVGVLALRCLARACRLTGPGDVVVLVSGYMYPLAVCGACTSGRVLVYILRDFSRLAPRPPPAAAAAAKKLALGLADRRNAAHFVSIVDPATAAEGLGLGRPVTYIPPVGVRGAVDRVDRGEARERLGLPSEATLFLVFGVGHGGKDYPTIFEALRSVRGDAVVVFAGASGGPNDASRLRDRLGVGDRVVIHDRFIPSEEVGAYFCAADALLLSYHAGYVVDSGIVRSGVEYALPMIGNDTGSIGQALRRWSLGTCFRGGDPRSLAEAIDAFSALDPAARDRFAEGRARYAAEHTWSRVAREHLALYRRLRASLPVRGRRPGA